MGTTIKNPSTTIEPHRRTKDGLYPSHWVEGVLTISFMNIYARLHPL